MNTKPVNKWTWKDSELVTLIEEYKLEVPSPFNRKDAIEMLNEQEKKVALAEVKDELVETEKVVEEISKEKEIDPERRLVTVQFHSLGENDLPYVPCGINGAFFYFPKEKEIKVPKFILNVLKDAVEDRMFPESNPLTGKIIWKKRKVQRFPYSIIDF